MPTVAEWLAAANAANAMLASLLTPPEPPVVTDPWVTLVEEKSWEVADISGPTSPWIPVDRPNEQTFAANLGFVGGKLQFNKLPTSPSGYSSSVIYKRGLPPLRMARMKISLEVTYPLATWPIFPTGCKHLFWAGQNGSNHFIGTRANYGGGCQPTLGLQNPNMTYYCDFTVVKGEPYTMEVVLDFAEKWLEIWVNGVRRKVNSASWITPDVYRVEGVKFFNDGALFLESYKVQFEPTELQTVTGQKMMHQYGPLTVKGIPA